MTALKIDHDDLPLVDIQDVTINYEGSGWGAKRNAPAVENVSLSLASGQVLGLVGESGSGKTTLARAIAGLIPVRSGRIFWQDKSITALSARQRLKLGIRTGLVFQDPQSSLNPLMPLWRLVTEPAAIQGVAASKRRQMAIDLLAQVQLDGALADRRPFELSGGQRQRVAIARSLCCDPALLILDEPTSALDVTVQAQILQLLADLRRQLNITMLFISHDLMVVRRLCDRIAVMRQGRIVESSSTAEIFDNPAQEYTRALIAATPQLRQFTIAEGPSPVTES